MSIFYFPRPKSAVEGMSENTLLTQLEDSGVGCWPRVVVAAAAAKDGQVQLLVEITVE